ncbi:MAG: FKBP-type peptidyl-prolyl cis-trans isomerase N-terminal domain-containing protein, partial [Planctomycetota bacterium]|nr:FKBP-type peptidyl-prolyl cis-trans isomerase N-terminal domain-containing protein [Planctomycetota bacterium]
MITRKLLLTITLTPFVSLPAFSQEKPVETKTELNTVKQKASYLVGFDIGEDVLRRELDVDYETLIQGFLDAVKKKSPPLSKAEMESIMQAFEKQVAEKANAKWKILS